MSVRWPCVTKPRRGFQISKTSAWMVSPPTGDPNVARRPSGVTALCIAMIGQLFSGDHMPFAAASDGMVRFCRSGSGGCGMGTACGCAVATAEKQHEHTNASTPVKTVLRCMSTPRSIGTDCTLLGYCHHLTDLASEPCCIDRPGIPLHQTAT